MSAVLKSVKSLLAGAVLVTALTACGGGGGGGEPAPPAVGDNNSDAPGNAISNCVIGTSTIETCTLG